MARRIQWLVMLGLLLSMRLVTAEVSLLPVSIDVHDQAKLQRGAAFYMNYCSGCHALRYLRYNRMAVDLGLTTDSGQLDKPLLINNLLFTKAPVHEPVEVSLPAMDARQWFGRVPPDLSLSARAHGASWLYTYLKSFYEDKKRPFGTNNLLVPYVAMPNVLAPLRGVVVAKTSSDDNALHLVLIKSGTMTELELDSALQDLVTFLVYVAEPAKLIRYRIGYFVITYLCIFLVVVYLLKQSYWNSA